MYVYYRNISAGPCLSGATRLRSHVGFFLSSYQVNLYSYQVICTSSLRISAQVIGSLDLVCLLGPRMKLLPSTFCLASALGLPGGIPKYMKIPTCFQDPHKSEKVSPRPPTNSKMTPKTFPPGIKLVSKWKKKNHSKTSVLLLCL